MSISEHCHFLQHGKNALVPAPICWKGIKGVPGKAVRESEAATYLSF